MLLVGAALTIVSCSKNDTTGVQTGTTSPISYQRLYGSSNNDYIVMSAGVLQYNGQNYMITSSGSNLSIMQNGSLVANGTMAVTGSTQTLSIPGPSPFGSTVYMSH